MVFVTVSETEAQTAINLNELLKTGSDVREFKKTTNKQTSGTDCHLLERKFKSISQS